MNFAKCWTVPLNFFVYLSLFSQTFSKPLILSISRVQHKPPRGFLDVHTHCFQWLNLSFLSWRRCLTWSSFTHHFLLLAKSLALNSASLVLPDSQVEACISCLYVCTRSQAQPKPNWAAVLKIKNPDLFLPTALAILVRFYTATSEQICCPAGWHIASNPSSLGTLRSGLKRNLYWPEFPT